MCSGWLTVGLMLVHVHVYLIPCADLIFDSLSHAHAFLGCDFMQYIQQYQKHLLSSALPARASLPVSVSSLPASSMPIPTSSTPVVTSPPVAALSLASQQRQPQQWQQQVGFATSQVAVSQAGYGSNPSLLPAPPPVPAHVSSVPSTTTAQQHVHVPVSQTADFLKDFMATVRQSIPVSHNNNNMQAAADSSSSSLVPVGHSFDNKQAVAYGASSHVHVPVNRSSYQASGSGNQVAKQAGQNEYFQSSVTSKSRELPPPRAVSEDVLLDEESFVEDEGTNYFFKRHCTNVFKPRCACAGRELYLMHMHLPMRTCTKGLHLWCYHYNCMCC